MNLFLLFVQNVYSFLLIVTADLWQAASLRSDSGFHYWLCSIVIDWSAVLITVVGAVWFIITSFSSIVVTVIVHVAYLGILHTQSLSQRIYGLSLFIWPLDRRQIHPTIRFIIMVIVIGTPIKMFLIFHDVIQPRRVPFFILTVMTITAEVLIIPFHGLLVNTQVGLTCLCTFILSRSYTK